MAEQRQLIYKLLLELGTAEKDAKGLASEIEKIVDAANNAAGATDGFGNSISNTIKGIRSQITELKKQRDNTEIGSEAFVKYNVQIKDLEAQLKQATNATTAYGSAQQQTAEQTKELAKLQENQARSAGLAGAAAFELGRTISDLPFGLVAISNNISQLGTLFAALVANAGGVGKALGFLRNQLLNPVTGVLIAFQVVTAAITFFSQRSNKAKKDVQDFSNELLLQSNILQALRKDFLDTNSSLQERIKILNTLALTDKNLQAILKDQSLTEQERTKRAEDYIETIMVVEEEEKKLAKLRQDIEEDGRSLDELRASRAEKELEILALRNTAQTSSNALIVAGAELEITIREQQILRLDEQIGKYETIKQQTLDIAKLRQSAEVQDKKTAEERLRAEEALFDARIDLEEKILGAESERLSESELQQVESQLRVQKELFDIQVRRLHEAERRELEGVTNPATIKAIKDKYKVLAESAALDFKSAVENIKFEKIKIELQPVIVGEDLLDGPELTEAQKVAGAQLAEYADGAMKQFRSFVRTNDRFKKAKEEVEKEFTLEDGLKLAQQSLDSMFGLFESQFERELALEQGKTIAINDQLRERLRNEQLTAEERDKINQQIARNDAELLKKQNEIEKKRFELNKAASISNAIISTASAVVSALDDLPVPANFIAAGVVAATGAAQIAAIANQQFVPTASPTPNLTAQGTGGGAAPSFNVVGSSTRNQLAEAVSSALSDKPVKAYVVSSDVTTSQELDRKIIEGASI